MSKTEITEQSKNQEIINAIKVNSAIFKLVETIEKKTKAGHTDKELAELKQLKEQCGSDDPLICVTACHGLVHLVKLFICPLSNTVSALVASLFSVKSVTGVVSALSELLILELRCQLSADNVYKSPYNIKSHQHPLVSVLKRRPNAWPDVLNSISAICGHPDKSVLNHRLDLVKPVLVYVLIESTDLPQSCRFQAFKIIINYFSDSDFLLEALTYCLCWEDCRVLEIVEIVSSVSQSAVSNKNGLLVSLSCLVLAAIIPRVLKAALCPHPVLQQISTLAPLAPNTHSTIIILLVDSVLICPSPYLEHLLGSMLELLEKGQCSLDCSWMCVSALLPWLATNPSHLHKAVYLATRVVTHANANTANISSTSTLITNTVVGTLSSADSKLTQAIHLARLSEILNGDAAIYWIQQNKPVELDMVHLYMSALLLSRKESQVKLSALQALVDSEASIATALNLTLLLYQLAREKQPDIHLALLRALPSTAVDKSNVMSVVSTLEALRRSGQLSLSLLAVDLYCQLWMKQERCFPQLMDILNQDHACFEEPCLSHMLQANVCKIICETKPELHGKEVVAKVSDLLNRCGGAKDSAASALALDALIPLCRHDVVDVFTIWRSLSPRFSREKRPFVLKSLCELVSLATVQKSASSEAEDTLIHILKWLWNLVGSNKNTDVIDAALKALSLFRPDQMTLKMLPECFRKGVQLPPEMVKTPADAARKPEDVLDYVPGECWIQVIQHLPSESTSLAIASWVKMEVASFRGSSLYQVDRPEPLDYNHLPRQSVVRGLVTSMLKLCYSSAQEHVKIINLCLVALIQPTPKPLPSLKWAFLQDLQTLGDPELSRNIISIASKQSQISPSARRITESFIANSGNEKNDVEFLYSILTDMCRGIPPNVLRPFLEKTLITAVKEKDIGHFSKIIGYIKTTLREEKIHDANRNLLHQQVKGLWDIFDPQSEMLADYFSCVSELPVSVTESMTSTSLMWEVTSAQLQKAFRLRAFMALIPDASQPLNWLNEIIEVASTNIGEQSLAFQLVAEVITKLHSHSTAWAWLLELMGQIHLTANNKGEVEFLVSVFMMCVDIISGYNNLTTEGSDTRALRFPQAVVSLVKRYGDAETMVEWLNHIRSCETFPSQYTAQFQFAARNTSILCH